MAGDPVSTSQLISDAHSGTPPLEQIPAGEPAAIAAIVKAIEARVRAAAGQGPAHRDAHPKAHGCAKAQLRVFPDLPPALAVGLFTRPAAYEAWVRFSNGAEKPQGDAVGDGRGMAIKVMGVPGSPSGTQDFVMINAPAFFVRNAADYVDFQAASAGNPLSFFFPGLNPFRFRLHELKMARAITSQVVSNPLSSRYWSMTPLLLDDVPCKISVKPVGPASPFQDRTAENFLHDNLARGLEAAEAAFDLCVQVRTQLTGMPVEDPTIAWSETDAPFVPVARLTLPRQRLDALERIAFGENLSFTPWHGLEAHRPLGGINRVRRTVYETISRLRHGLNHAPRVEPSGFQTTDPSGL